MRVETNDNREAVFVWVALVGAKRLAAYRASTKIYRNVINLFNLYITLRAGKLSIINMTSFLLKKLTS